MNRPSLNPFFAPTANVSDDEDNDIMDGVNSSFDQIEHTVLALRRRGDEYKQSNIATKKQVSDLRLEKAEACANLLRPER